jgi:hypothetical protein
LRFVRLRGRLRNDTASPMLFDNQPIDLNICFYCCTELPCPRQETFGDLCRSVGCRKDPAVSFDNRINTPLFEERPEVIAEKPREHLAQECVMLVEMADKCGESRGVGDVTAAMAGQSQLYSRQIHFLEQPNARSGACRPARGHDPCRPGADNDNMRAFQDKGVPLKLNGFFGIMMISLVSYQYN